MTGPDGISAVTVIPYTGPTTVCIPFRLMTFVCVRACMPVCVCVRVRERAHRMFGRMINGDIALLYGSGSGFSVVAPSSASGAVIARDARAPAGGRQTVGFFRQLVQIVQIGGVGTAIVGSLPRYWNFPNSVSHKAPVAFAVKRIDASNRRIKRSHHPHNRTQCCGQHISAAGWRLLPGSLRRCDRPPDWPLRPPATSTRS